MSPAIVSIAMPPTFDDALLTADTRQVEVVLRWRGRVVDVKRFSQTAGFSIGTQATDDVFVLVDGGSWTLLTMQAGQRCKVRLHTGLSGTITRGDQSMPLAALRSSARFVDDDAVAVAVTDDMVVTITMGRTGWIEALFSSGCTGHTKVVLVVYDPENVALETLLQLFWQSHDPTQGMRQHKDVGTQYRSALYFSDEETKATALASHDAYDAALERAGLGAITTELTTAPPFYYAEDHHQQYLEKNPSGYCGLAGTCVSYPIDATSSS